MGNCFDKYIKSEKQQLISKKKLNQDADEHIQGYGSVNTLENHPYTRSNSISIPTKSRNRKYSSKSECEQILEENPYLLPKQDIKYANSLTVVLDLDETLACGRLLNFSAKGSVIGKDYKMIVRPFTLELLYLLKSWGNEVIIWSAGMKTYVLQALYYILNGNLEIIDHIIWRDSRWSVNNDTHPIKKLNILGRDMDRLLFIDNNIEHVINNPYNSICVRDFDLDYVSKNSKEKYMETDIFTKKEISEIDFAILNEKITSDATLLVLACTINWINQEFDTGRKSGNILSVKHLLERESRIIGSFVTKKRINTNKDKNEYSSTKYHTKYNIKNDVNFFYFLQDMILSEYNTLFYDAEFNDNVYNYTINNANNAIDTCMRFKESKSQLKFTSEDYLKIIKLINVDIKKPSDYKIKKLSMVNKPITIDRSHLIINPQVIEKRYFAQEKYNCLKYINSYDSDELSIEYYKNKMPTGSLCSDYASKTIKRYKTNMIEIKINHSI